MCFVVCVFVLFCVICLSFSLLAFLFSFFSFFLFLGGGGGGGKSYLGLNGSKGGVIFANILRQGHLYLHSSDFSKKYCCTAGRRALAHVHAIKQISS